MLFAIRPQSYSIRKHVFELLHRGGVSTSPQRIFSQEYSDSELETAILTFKPETILIPYHPIEHEGERLTGVSTLANLVAHRALTRSTRVFMPVAHDEREAFDRATAAVDVAVNYWIRLEVCLVAGPFDDKQRLVDDIKGYLGRKAWREKYMVEKHAA